MNKIFSQALKYFAGGDTILAYSAWYERIKTPQKTLEFKNEKKESQSADWSTSVFVFLFTLKLILWSGLLKSMKVLFNLNIH